MGPPLTAAVVRELSRDLGDIDAAAEWLRKSGLAKADKKASRVAAEGRIGAIELEHHRALARDDVLGAAVVALRADHAKGQQQQRQRRHLAERDDDVGLQQFDLPFQVRTAGSTLLRRRRPVAAIGADRAALDHVGDIGRFSASQPERAQHVVEQLAGRTDERFALLVLGAARTFADEQPARLAIADARHRELAPLAQSAAGAGTYR